VNLLVAASTEIECRLLKGRLRTVVTGVGQVNMAHALTVEIERARPDQIWVVGIGGAYPGSGLAVGDVVCAESETFGDLGVETPEGFLELTEFLRNWFPVEVQPLARRARFVTVSTCSGTEELAERLRARTGGAVENMEGAAAAQIAARYGIPLAEIRGISNLTGRRDRAAWKIAEAAEAAQAAVLAALGSAAMPQGNHHP
jgi:futalosine hydrolase